MQSITIKSGKEKQLLRHHPWVFSGAIATSESDESGVAKVLTEEGKFIAWGWYDKESHIPLHLLSWNEKDHIDDYWWAETIKKSVLRRSSFFQDKASPNTTFRIIFGEADMLPGLVADVYGTLIRIIISARVAWDHKDLVVETLQNLLNPAMIIVTTDSAFCASEHLSETALFWQNGAYFTPSKKLDPIRFREDNLLYEIIPGRGQKSGFYCDQRENRKAIEPYCKDAVVLDGCSYTGAFTLHALRSGAKQVDCLDSSNDALHQSLVHIHINQDAKAIPADSREKVTTTCCNIFEQMRLIEENKYDLIILDPPKLAQTKAQADNAAKAYKDLNRLAMQKIKNGGIIATFSCSGAISSEMLRTILAWSAKDAQVEIQILRVLGQGEDHPIRISFPESEYLKGYILRVIR
ncbi:putative SAM-dependent methyltransferase [Sphaerochaeta pleomorpha str. Grapes]|uniref:Putative SAM-dependent methyltransferase n=1 Tax=Sphaerochaeta pleomorpha (strain ATCC BAA-1885 / DSM 22778 / Grapes) TaxID=158190 RepID=G8QXR5_SPHPG|nr:class I SAM-dependent rRNA methyltransferase [Sphaerochaeta pleomorpha]AEV30709.1 putative SAM-dependent methyltransferase [Sphaerochaeta pleomorpha str. Grapes]